MTDINFGVYKIDSRNNNIIFQFTRGDLGAMVQISLDTEISNLQAIKSVLTDKINNGKNETKTR